MQRNPEAGAVRRAADRCADFADTILNHGRTADLDKQFFEARNALLRACMEVWAAKKKITVRELQLTPQLVIEAAWDAGALFDLALHRRHNDEAVDWDAAEFGPLQ